MVVQVLNSRGNLVDKGTNATSRVFEADREAFEWNKAVDHLKYSLDEIYAMCWATHNISAAKEALMYFEAAVRDFRSLITSLNVELDWENPENRPHTAIGYELSGAMYSKPNRTDPTADGSIFANSTCSRSKRRIKETNDSSDEEKKVDVYERLAYGKRSNVNRTTADCLYEEESQNDPAHKHAGRLMTTPRSAMDIPQTKSSMAKIAFSRQLLWERHKIMLKEKLSAKRRQEQSIASIGNRRRSLPVLAKRTTSQPAEPNNLEAIREEERNEVLENSSTKTHAGHFTTRSDPHGYALQMLDLSNDDEWQALTEEECSLVQEEESLKKEIEEEESITIDEEIQRRVILDFSDVDMEADECKRPWRSVVDEWTISDGNEDVRTSVDVSCMTADRDCRFRRPGAAAEVHQRLLSPIRRRNLDVDEILERQNKAEELRLMLQENKARRLRELHMRVEEVRRKREEIVERKRAHMEDKMSKATENRQKNLEDIVKKAKDDNSKVLEVAFISTMEAENARAELGLLEQDREQRLSLIAEERARLTRDKASNKAAADERRRIADQQRAEWLREEANKTKERQLMAETQRLEMLESYRQRMKLRGQKAEERRAQEVAEAKSLQHKIQDKHDKSSQRYEHTISEVRQKAVECATPKISQPWTQLAEFQLPPSDLKYPSGCAKECVCCAYTPSSDLDLVAHLLSADHLERRKVDRKHVGIEYMKQELNNQIRRTDQPDVHGEPTADLLESLAEKEAADLRQRMGKTIKLELVHGLPAGVTMSYEKKLHALSKALASPSGQRGSSAERLLSDFARRLAAESSSKRASVSVWAFGNGLVDLLVQAMGKSAEASAETFVKRNHKCLTLLRQLLTADQRVAVSFLYSEHLHSLLDWTAARWERTQQSAGTNHVDLLSALCILNGVLEDSRKFVNSLSADEGAAKFADLPDRLDAVATFLLRTFFPPFFRFFAADGVERVEVENGRFVRPLSLATALLIALAADNPDGLRSAESSLFKLFAASIRALIVELYAKIRTDVVVSIESDSTALMTSSVVSNTSSWPSIPNGDVLLASLVQLWNAVNSSPAVSSRQIEEVLRADGGTADALRFVSILISALRSIEPPLGEPAGEIFSLPPVSLRSVLLAICHFLATDFKGGFPLVMLRKMPVQILCTIGSRLAVQLSQLPFECLQNTSTRPLILTALVALLFEDAEGVECIRSNVSPSWMAAFLENHLKERVCAADERAFLSRVLPRAHWSAALEFFAGLQ